MELSSGIKGRNFFLEAQRERPIHADFAGPGLFLEQALSDEDMLNFTGADLTLPDDFIERAENSTAPD